MLLEATTVQTLIREINADLETPVSLYLKLRGDGPSFLLESVEGGERIAAALDSVIAPSVGATARPDPAVTPIERA